MRQEARTAFDRALRRAREAAFAPGEYVEQESFMRAGEILALARRAGVGPGASVLDLCCGVAGPGRFITRELGCAYLGIDSSRTAVAIARARARAAAAACRFRVARVPPVPPGTFHVVLLLETMLAFQDKRALLQDVARALPPGGRFAFTLEEGRPLSPTERERMPDADTVWLTPVDELEAMLGEAGFEVVWHDDCSGAHRAMAERLTAAFAADAAAIAGAIGRSALDELLAAHRLWCDWLAAGRVRKLALVAQKRSTIA